MGRGKWVFPNEYGLPMNEGIYWIRVGGDSESVDGQTVYEYEDYTTLGEITFNEKGERTITLEHGLNCEPEEVIGWWFEKVEKPEWVEPK